MSCFADVGSLQPQGLVGFVCDPAPDQELLEEAIYLIDARDAVPVQVALARSADGGLVGEFGVDIPQVGPVPKAVARHGLFLEHHDSSWQCRVVIDV